MRCRSGIYRTFAYVLHGYFWSLKLVWIISMHCLKFEMLIMLKCKVPYYSSSRTLEGLAKLDSCDLKTGSFRGNWGNPVSDHIKTKNTWYRTRVSKICREASGHVVRFGDTAPWQKHDVWIPQNEVRSSLPRFKKKGHLGLFT
jgi:hypothetical protein